MGKQVSRASDALAVLVRSVVFGVALVAVSACGDDGSDGSGAGGNASGKTSSPSTGTGDCIGGVIKDGICEGKCKPELCLEGNICVDNRCVLPCEGHEDCIVGEQTCAPAVEDDTGAGVNVCLYSTKAASIGKPCLLSTECGATSACPDGTPCGVDAMGVPIENATCAGDACKPLICLTAGAGDADAVCSTVDCQVDADCAGGMYCGVRRLVQKECGTPDADPADCINAADFNKGGATIQKGPFGLVRNVCKVGGQCAPCASNLDCSLRDNQACVNIGGELRCAAGCNVGADCEDDHNCIGGYCVPKFNLCVGSGQFCEPCLDDLDCAANGPSWACGNSTGNQRACYDAAFGSSCTSSAQCPESPSGRHGACVDLDGNGAADSCYFPMVGGKYMCWPPNPLP